jgi:hypothetical protein
MADIKVQRGTVTFTASGNLTETITAGTNYTAPSSSSKAFVRIVGVNSFGTGASDSDFSGAFQNHGVYIANGGNITTSVNFTRVVNTKPFVVHWEIVEYTGSVGGSNEFVVRGAYLLGDSFSNNNLTYTTSSVSGIITDADVCVFLTGQAAADTSRTDCDGGLATTSWNSAGDTATVTRGSATTIVWYTSISVVEFTGSNWTVQRIEHSFSSAGVTETETISSVGSTGTAFGHFQHRGNETGDVGAFNRGGFEAYISSATQVSFYKSALFNTANHVVAWVVSNPNLNVQRISGSRSNGAGGSSPDSWTETLGAAVTSLDAASVFGECARTDKADDNHLGMMAFALTGTSTVTLYRGRDTGIRNYRFEVVSWPSAAPTGLTITSVTPSSFDSGIAGIVIAGSGFGASQGSSTVDIGGQAQTVTSWSDTSITFTSARGSNSMGAASLKLTRG